MSNCCDKKKTFRDVEEKKKICNRLSRIGGQVDGVKKMIEDDAYCNDVLIQLAAIENAVKSLSNHILENHLHTCITKEVQDGNTEAIDEIIELFKKFNKK